jgi:uncharacterized protein (DUF1330 family)
VQAQEIRMTRYAYGEIILKKTNWVGEYVRKIKPFIEKHGGRVLSRTTRMEKVEGARSLPTNVILVEFPDRESACAFFNDPDYQPLRALRVDGSVSEFTLFPAEDLAKEDLMRDG